MFNGFENCEGFLGILEKLNKYSATENVSAVKGVTLPELARITGMSWGKMREYIRVLEKMGMVERFGVGKHAVYSIKIGKNRLMLMP
ncbi:MAG: winged helix-turn-helix domain-containing protein [Candidatus Altiarchaeia archaeon]|jgi:DNA-binding transcriptional ArsR family regulator